MGDGWAQFVTSASNAWRGLAGWMGAKWAVYWLWKAGLWRSMHNPAAA